MKAVSGNAGTGQRMDSWTSLIFICTSPKSLFRIYFCKSMAGSQPASLRLAMSLKPQIAMHRSSSARNDFRKWVRLSVPP
jgi:hypothetical protein